MRWVLALAAALLAGCVTYHRGTFVAVSTESLDLPRTIVAERAEGRSCAAMLEPRYELAVRDALERNPGADALIDATYTWENLCLVVRGTAVRLEAPPATPGAPD